MCLAVASLHRQPRKKLHRAPLSRIALYPQTHPAKDKESHKDQRSTIIKVNLSATMAHILSAVSGSETDIVPITRALISVSDKTGIVDLCTFLHTTKNVELLSTGGTAKALRDAGLPCIDVSEYTGSPECLDGRVKTLHPKVHGGLLAVRGNAKHEQDMLENKIGKIDMTILNLYPFAATVASGAEFGQCIENIDIGGPSMLRSTAKNHAFTTIVTGPDQYDEIKACIEEHGGTTLALRKKFAARAFALSASYDSAIATWFAKQLEEGGESSSSSSNGSSPVVTRVYKPEFPLKYGECYVDSTLGYKPNFLLGISLIYLSYVHRMQPTPKASRYIFPPWCRSSIYSSQWYAGVH